MADSPQGEPPDEGAEAFGLAPAQDGDDAAVAELTEALTEATGKLQPLDTSVQARRWARERSVRLEGTAELLRVLLAALGYPTRDGTAEFSTFDAERVDPATTRSIKRTARAILADLEAAAKAPWTPPDRPDR